MPGLQYFAYMVAALALMATGAHAGEASAVADRGGFLLGHAYRCGVAAERLDRSAKLVHDLIDALSDDAEDKAAADQAFADRFLQSLVAAALRDPAPSCALVRGKLAQLEQHEPTASAEGETRVSNENRSENAPPQHRRTLQTARSKKPASTRREDLTAERRADLARELAAKQHRNRPPSI